MSSSKFSTGDLLTEWQQKNLEKYCQVLDQKRPFEPHNLQAFILTQNPDYRFKSTRDGILPAFTATDSLCWLRQESRLLTALEKFALHGFPVTDLLASKMKVPASWPAYIYIYTYGVVSQPLCFEVAFIVSLWSASSSGKVPSHVAEAFKLDGLSNAHRAVGNGQHMPVAGMVLASALSSVHISTGAELPRTISECHKLLPVSADGRCFWTCLALHRATLQEKQEWLGVLRSPQGFALDSKRHQYEVGCGFNPSQCFED